MRIPSFSDVSVATWYFELEDFLSIANEQMRIATDHEAMRR